MTDHIYLFSPSGAVTPATLESSIENLKALGYKVSVDRAAFKRHMRFAGTDNDRLGAFTRAARSKASIAMITRGGYGISRFLHQLDFKALAGSGKKWVGHSDFTAFTLGMLAQTRAQTYAGPEATSFAAQSVADIDEVTLGCFQEMMSGITEAIGWQCTGSPKCEAKGVLWGGNLAMVESLLGTPYFPAVKKGIFFCEDVNEFPYRTERRFAQLLHAGVLQRQSAVLIGQFTDYKLYEHDAGFDMPVVIKWLRDQLKPFGVPVITGLPFGHVRTKLTLPVGRRVQLLASHGEAFVIL
jgi:muramoyltetrapeptide carboxypeptidase